MPDNTLILILADIGILFMAGFFAGVESAYVALDRILINRYDSSDNFFARKIVFFSKNFDFLLISILFFNLAVHSSFTTVNSILFNNILMTYAPELFSEEIINIWIFDIPVKIIQVVIFVVPVSIVILLLGEILPKRIAIKYPSTVARIGVIPLIFVYYVFYPFSALMNRFSRALMGTFIKSNIQNTSAFDTGEFLGYIKLGSDTGLLKQVESTILESMVNYKSMMIKSVLIPRQQVEGFDLSHLPRQMDKAIREFRYNNIPIYDKLKDNIVGVLSKKKLAMLEDLGELKKKTIKKYMDVPEIVPESNKMIDVLAQMYRMDKELAVVTDEYGGVEGIVTYTDIVQRLMGKHEGSEAEIEGIRQLGAGIFFVNPQTPISEVNEYFGTRIKCDKAETMGGYLIELISDLPKSGDVIYDRYFEYHIKAANKRKILRLSLRKKF